VLPTLERWLEGGHRFALATVTQTWGSSPRPVGAVMGVREDGVAVGSVSGGCVEGAVMQAALDCLRSGKPRMLDFGALSDESVWEVGLSCGGRIQVWVDPDPMRRPVWQSIVSQINSKISAALITRFEPFEQWTSPEEVGSTALVSLIESAIQRGQSTEIEAEEDRYFVQVFPLRERLIIVGAVHIAIPLIRFAKELGFETMVIDPRPQLATTDRFPTAPDMIVAEWPERALAGLELTNECYCVVLTHDPKIDDVALAVFLRSPAAYIGALGSRVTQEKRRRELVSQGFAVNDLARIHGPVGLNIGARSPEEIALSIMAEIVQVRRAKD
jgi:xanthine dehydrogenase accessory factor